MDIFRQDAFSMGSLTGTIQRIPYEPMLLGSLNLARPMPIRTEFASIEEKGKKLAIIQTSARGAPLEQGRTNKRKLRRFDTVRLAKGDRVNAAEIQGIRAFGSETELMQVQELVVEKQTELRRDLELTFENHRLGMINGLVLDADGTVIVDWFAEFNIERPDPISLGLSTATTDVELAIRQKVLRPMARAAQGLWLPNTYAAALCGDSFFDKLTNHKTVRETYLNTVQAQALRNAFGPAADSLTGAFAVYWYGGVLWINYRGVDDFDEKAEPGTRQAMGVRPKEAKLFPINAPGVFMRAQSPGEAFAYVNTPGRDMYSEIEIEKRTNPRFVDLEIYSYPLFICTRPEILRTVTE
ncbi:hypothetical protein BA190_09400 [Labrys sp. WJW]|nr:hypothetical protein BA190_09400 [Labrys sp. WJW]